MTYLRAPLAQMLLGYRPAPRGWLTREQEADARAYQRHEEIDPQIRSLFRLQNNKQITEEQQHQLWLLINEDNHLQEACKYALRRAKEAQERYNEWRQRMIRFPPAWFTQYPDLVMRYLDAGPNPDYQPTPVRQHVPQHREQMQRFSERMRNGELGPVM
jgi:hypothetical protein